MKFYFLLFLLTVLTPFIHGQKFEVTPEVFKSLSVRDLTMGEFANLLSRSGSLQVITSKEAAKVKISFYLQGVSATEALEAVCRSNGLVARSNGGKISFVYTQEEFTASQGIYNDEEMEAVQLKYASSVDVGETLRNLFADRVVWVRPAEPELNSEEKISDALDRMDILASNEIFTSGEKSSSSSNDSNDSDSNNNNNRTNSNSARSGNVELELQSTFREILKENRALSTNVTGEEQNRLGVVFVSAFPSTNILLLRSTDSKTLAQIKETIADLDKPTPQVLLEVKVLEVDLGDGESLGIDWAYSRGDGAIGFVPPGGTSNASSLENVIGNETSEGAGFDPRTTVLSIVSDNVVANVQAMQSQGRLVQLATPTLLVANDEASRVFVGSEVRVLEDVNPGDTIVNDNTAITTEATPELGTRNVGMQLLINPRINADRSVTLRILQEDSSLGQQRAISFGDESIATQDVLNRSVVSTVVAQDRNWVMIGGLIREREDEKTSGVPVLKDIPYLGSLFRSKGKTKTRSELIILIHPVVLLAPGEEEPASKDLLKKLSKHRSVQPDGNIKELGIDTIEDIYNNKDKKADKAEASSKDSKK